MRYFGKMQIKVVIAVFPLLGQLPALGPRVEWEMLLLPFFLHSGNAVSLRQVVNYPKNKTSPVTKLPINLLMALLFKQCVWLFCSYCMSSRVFCS